MAKQRGHRANKPNDSFGTINNDQLYRGKYREEVYKEDDEETEVVEAEAPSEETQEATPEAETDYKKRYDDLKRHYDSKLDEWKKEKEDLAQTRQVATEQGIAPSELPKTPEELEAFREKYPDMYAIVETVSTIQAERKLQTLQEEVQTLKGREEELKIQSAYKELLNQHPDFNTLRTDEKFLAWLDDQPESIADGIYKNNMDVKWASRVLDLYKADIGMRKTTKKKEADPAAAVTKPSAKDISSDKGDKKIWTASEIRKLKPWQFEKLESEIDAAKAEGRLDLTK